MESNPKEKQQPRSYRPIENATGEELEEDMLLKARFFFMRTVCGLGQGDVARMFQLDVRQVKRFENDPRYPMPADLYEWMGKRFARHNRVVSNMLRDIHDGLEDGSVREPIRLPLYKTQHDYKTMNPTLAPNWQFYREINSQTFDVQQVLEREGYEVEAWYPAFRAYEKEKQHDGTQEAVRQAGRAD